MIQKIKNKLFRRKLANLGLDMENQKEAEFADALNERGLGGDHFVKCMEVAIKTKNLQKVCEVLCGRKEAGRYLQIKPLVIQCHSCQKDFSNEKGVNFAGKVKCLGEIDKIVEHLISCDGIICDCGKKVLYFDECKKCKRKWDERSYCLRKWNPKMRTPEQKEQIKKYNKLISNTKE